jgi:Cystathionine beta-lyases/cystathionine gamma-synthases
MKNFNTICVHGSHDSHNDTGAITVPIYQSATFAHPAFGKSTGYDYSRLQNPTKECAEVTVANLEGAKHALAFSSGMAAMASLMELFCIGDEIIASDDLYGGSIRLFDNISAKNGIKIHFTNTSNLDDIHALINKNTKAIFIETPTNPMMRVTDIKAVSAISKIHKLLLIVDNTFLTPYFQKPLSLDADIVLHSATKYLGGHNDTLAGFLVLNDDTIAEKLKYIHKTTGACLSPFDSFLIIRGIKTLAIRMQRQAENALTIAKWLENQSSITEVFYVGLQSHPDYEISKVQASGFGAMISFRTENVELAYKILENTKIIQFAESLGGVETLITYPLTQTHADVPAEKLAKNGIDNCLLRLSVGIEDIDDLIADLSYAISC